MTDEKVKDFVAINFSEYFKSTRKKLYSQLSEEQNRKTVAEFLYIFLTTPVGLGKYIEVMQSSYSDKCIHSYNVEILNLFDQELQLINTKTMMKNKLKESLSELKVESYTILAFDYKKISNRN